MAARAEPRAGQWLQHDSDEVSNSLDTPKSRFGPQALPPERNQDPFFQEDGALVDP